MGAIHAPLPVMPLLAACSQSSRVLDWASTLR